VVVIRKNIRGDVQGKMLGSREHKVGFIWDPKKSFAAFVLMSNRPLVPAQTPTCQRWRRRWWREPTMTTNLARRRRVLAVVGRVQRATFADRSGYSTCSY